jgi:hypothetical protein
MIPTVYFVQIASLYCGKLLAAGLPSKQIGFGKYKFDLVGPKHTQHISTVLRPRRLEPWPFHHQRTCCDRSGVSLLGIAPSPLVIMTGSANTGATNNLGDYVLAPLAVFYDKVCPTLLSFVGSTVGLINASIADERLARDPVHVERRVHRVFPCNARPYFPDQEPRHGRSLSPVRESSVDAQQLFPLTLQQVSVCASFPLTTRYILPTYLAPTVNAMRSSLDGNSPTVRAFLLRVRRAFN